VLDALTSPAFGAVYALGSAFFWALNSYLVRRYASFCSMVTINAVRISVSGLVLLVVSLGGPVRAELAALTLTTWVLMVSSTILAAGIGDSIFFECARILGLGRAMTLAMTYPLMAAALAAVFLGEAITMPQLLGATVTLAGLALIVLPRDSTAPPHPRLWLGVGASFVVALTWALSAILMKPAMHELTPLTAQGLRLPIVAAFLWLTPWARAGVPALRAVGRRAVVPMVLLSVLTALSSMTWIAGLKYSDVVVATVLSSTSPMFALALGAAFLGERLTPAAITGALLTIAGIVVLKV
jgi:drug/metabolite transporter (DMT)-like permease